MEETKTFAERIIAVQSALKAPKNQRNKFGGYNYRSCEDILEAVKPLLKEQGLFLTITDEIVLVGERYYVKATATLHDSANIVSNTAYAREDESQKGMTGSQLTGATSSYARKYALNGLLAIDDTKDADYLNTGDKGKQKQAKKTVEEVIAEVYQQTTESGIINIFKAHPEFASDTNLITACSQRKQQLKQFK